MLRLLLAMNIIIVLCRNACTISYSIIPRLGGEGPPWNKVRLPVLPYIGMHAMCGYQPLLYQMGP